MKIIKTKYTYNKIILTILRIKISFKYCKFPFNKIFKKFTKNTSFYCQTFDKEIAQITDKLLEEEVFKQNKINYNRIAILATLLDDMGGHTSCIKNLTKLLSEEYEICTFLTAKDESILCAPKKISIIEKYSKIDGIGHNNNISAKENLLTLFNKINEFSPKVLFVYMNPDDVLAAALLHIIKEYTDIKIIFDNHASHYPTLGMEFADAITYQLPSAHYVTKKYRKYDKGVNCNLSSEKAENITDISQQEKSEIRKELGIIEGNFFTLSGAASYKFFNKNSSEYFEMIKRLLEAEPKMQHVVITQLSKKEKNIINRIFNDSETKSRLKIINFTPEYSKIFQSCDLFIDSFPCGSALTHVELMKHKKMSVIKINTQNALLSFYEFFPSNYKYMFKNVEEMEKNILFLLHNGDEISKCEQELYQHFLNTFEGNFVKKQYINVIQNADNIEALYYKMPDNIHYNVELKQ